VATSRTAGFATVTSIGQDVVDGLLAAASASVTMPSFALPDVVTVGSDKIGLIGTLSLVAPTVTFSANPANLIAVTFGCSGTLSLTDNGTALIEVEVTLEATLDLGLVVDISTTALVVHVDTSTAVVSSVSIAVDFGPPLMAVYQAALQSGPVLASLSSALQSIPESAVTFTVPGASGTFDLNYGGVGVSLSISNVVVVPLDGVLNVAMDVESFTTGDVSNLVNLITTASPTPLYYIERTGQIAGGTFASHTIAEVGDGYQYGGINLAVAVNTDFLSAAFGGPLSNALAGTLLSVDASALTASYTIVAGDTVESIAAALFNGFENIETGQELSDVGMTLTLSGAVIKIAGPASAFPPAPYATRTAVVNGSTVGYEPTYVAIGPAAPNTSITITAVAPAGQTITVTIPAGGIAISSVTLQAQGMYATLPNCSPDLPTVIPFGCLTLTLNGELLAFFNPAPGVWAVGNEASFTFSLSLTPIVGSAGTGIQYNFPCANWNFSAPLLTFIDDIFPLGPFVFAGAINAAVSSYVSNGLASGGLFNLAAPTGGLSGSFPFPGNTKWNVAYALWGLVVCPPQSDPLYVGAELNAYAVVSVTGPASQVPKTPQFNLSADDGNTLVNLLPIPVQLTITNGATLFNPLLGLMIRWVASRNDTGVQVFSQDTALSTSKLAISIPRVDSGDLIYNDTWSVTCTVYRPADSLMPAYSYFNQTIQVGQVDVVDRHHPYVQWSHRIGIHDPAGPPPLKSHLLWFRQRKSRIHRTDLFTRCSMVDRAMNAHPSLPPQYLNSIAEYGTLEQLTNPHVVAKKSPPKALCDYCFFGGPRKRRGPASNDWLAPTAPTPGWV
jgi:hypothetical protein